MSLVKLALLLCSSISFHLGLGRPSSINEGDRVMVTTVRERIWRHVGLPSDLFLKGVIWQATIGESIIILSSVLDRPRPPDSALNALGPAEASVLTIPFVLGAALVTAGGILRVVCFRTLGPYYTFVQCIRQEHRLITSGPYSVMRHPGYAGLLYCLIGWSLVFATPGSWLRKSGVLNFTWSRALLGCSGLIAAASFVTVFRRSIDEDQFLSQKFGDEWKRWARRVKYRLIPFVY